MYNYIITVVWTIKQMLTNSFFALHCTVQFYNSFPKLKTMTWLKIFRVLFLPKHTPFMLYHQTTIKIVTFVNKNILQNINKFKKIIVLFFKDFIIKEKIKSKNLFGYAFSAKFTTNKFYELIVANNKNYYSHLYLICTELKINKQSWSQRVLHFQMTIKHEYI